MVVILRDEDFRNGDVPTNLKVVDTEDIKDVVRRLFMLEGRYSQFVDRVLFVPVDRPEFLVLYDKHVPEAAGRVYQRTSDILHLVIALGSNAIDSERYR